MTALVMSHSRQRNVQTHNVKVTCPHRQKSKEGMHLTSPFSWWFLFYQQTVFQVPSSCRNNWNCCHFFQKQSPKFRICLSGWKTSARGMLFPWWVTFAWVSPTTHKGRLQNMSSWNTHSSCHSKHRVQMDLVTLQGLLRQKSKHLISWKENSRSPYVLFLVPK